MREDLEKAMMEIGEPFSKEEVNNMMAMACDPETRRINYEHYIHLLLVRIDIYNFTTHSTYYKKIIKIIKFKYN